MPLADASMIESEPHLVIESEPRSVLESEPHLKVESRRHLTAVFVFFKQWKEVEVEVAGELVEVVEEDQIVYMTTKMACAGSTELMVS